MPELRVVFTETRIRDRVAGMAREIDAVYGEEPLVAVCVLKGAVYACQVTAAGRSVPGT